MSLQPDSANATTMLIPRMCFTRRPPPDTVDRFADGFRAQILHRLGGGACSPQLKRSQAPFLRVATGDDRVDAQLARALAGGDVVTPRRRARRRRASLM